MIWKERRRSVRLFWLMVVLMFSLLSLIVANASALHAKYKKKNTEKDYFGFYLERDLAIFKIEGVVIKMIPLSDICVDFKKKK